MKTAELFARIKHLGVTIEAEDGDLVLDGPIDLIDEALIDELRQQKPELLAYVAAQTIRRREEKGDCPLSFQQQRLWFLDQLAPGGPEYNVAAAYRVRGTIDAEQLQSVLDAVVARHAGLRTRFVTLPDGPVQRIEPDARVRLELHNLESLGQTRLEAARQLAAEHAARGFDLSKGPLLRVSLIRLGGDDHVLAVNMHHIISDGWSIGVMLRDVAQAYAGVELAPAALDYGDYATWQRGPGGAVQTADLDYWRAALANLPVLSTPTPDYPRPAMQNFEGARLGLSFDAALVERLKSVAQRHGATLYTVLLAAFGVVLSRHLRQSDLCIGSPVANRTRPGLEGIIGFFVNMLAMRVSPEPELSVGDYLDQVRDRVLAAFAHQDLPFDRLIEALELEHQLSHSPLFQTALVLQNAGGGQVDLPGLSLAAMESTTVSAKFDVTVTLHETTEGTLVGDLTYVKALYDPDRMERLSGHFVTMLHAIAGAKPETPLSDLQMLGLQERVLLTGPLGNGPKKVTKRNGAARIAELAQEKPDALAVVCGQDHLTRAQLNERAGALAVALQSAGVMPGDVVGIHAPPSLERIVSVLAVLRAGAAFLPLDNSYPPQRLAMMIEDASPKVIIGQDLPLEVACPVLGFGGAKGQPRILAPHPEAPAYVIFTSGSTGRPKGVVIPHRGLENLTQWQIDMAALGEGTRVSAAARFGFDGSVYETWPTLVAGGVLVLAPEAALEDPSLLMDWWADQRLDAGFLPTPLAELAMSENRQPESLRLLLTGGDRLRLTPKAELTYRVMNLYGPSEASVIVMAGHVGRGDSPPPIGTPIDNTSAYLLDAALNPVPIGAVGELYLAGPSLALGYINRPDLTAAAFTPDPFGPPGSRLYRTGDLGRLQPDGRMAFLGRADSQISLRGYRIEPGEIEQKLKELTDGAQVLVIENAGRLIAYVQTSQEIAPDRLRGSLSATLPEYMVPSTIIALPEWPLTGNGKLDRNALPVPDSAPAAFDPPNTATEIALAHIWEEVLDSGPISRQDSFFARGGHSLLATQAMSRTRAEFGTDLPLRKMFEANSLAALAAEIDAGRSDGPSNLPPLLPRLATLATADLPLSFAQQRLWFLDQLEPGNPFYAIPATLRLQGDLNVAALRQTLAALVQRHESLRTTFPLHDGVPVQRIAAHLEVSLVELDLSNAPEGALEAAQAMAEAEARTPFDLANGPMLRVSLLQIAPRDHVLLFNMHHIISDGWSMGVLVGEVAAIYRAIVEGIDSTLPPLAVQYGDFALWQRSWLIGQRLQDEEDYWRGNLGDLPPIPVQLPLDRPRPAAQSHRGATHSFDLGGDLTHGLRDLAQSHNVTLFMLLHAAYAVLLARYSGQTDIVVGSPIANRRVAALEPLVGFFVNTLVLRHQVDPSEPFLTLLDRVRQTALSAYDHQDLPFEHLVDLLNPDRNLAHAPIFQVGLVLQNMQQQRLDLPDLTLVATEAKAVTAKFDLALTLSEAGDSLHCDAEYATDLFDASSIERFCADFVRLLHAIVATPSRVVHQLAPPATADLDRIARWNSTETPITEPSVVAAIEAQAARQPDAVALIWQDARMSYGDLDRAANRIAHALRADGVRPGMLVGLGTGRGIAHVCGGLGILKAGACLVMLPMDAPEERLNYILADTGLRHVVGFASGNWPDAVAVIDPAADGHAETPLGLAASVDRSYVVYTSGTTGQPKGSVNSLIGLANFCEWYGRAYDLAPGHVVSSVSNVAFDGTVAEIWPTLTHGATLVLVPEDTLRDPWLLSAMLTEHGVNTLYLPMGYLDAIARSGFDWPSTLRRVLAGGDRMKGYLLPRELGLELVNVYGPSETQCVSSVEPIGPNHKGQVSIGRPIPNTRIHILDPLHNPLPPGAVGEICIAGIGVGEGYLNRPGLTAEKFVPDPFGPPGARMYLSGDMGRFLPDGRIDFVGRTDGQLKIRGFRIELDEIERAILDQPDVAETVVIAQKDEQAGHRLVAYVVPRRDASRDASHWQATFEQIYRDESQATGDSRFDIVGWTDSYTGAPIPADEMAEWLQETVSRIMSCNPARVLEVGVGTGMILHRVAPHAKRYTGTDLSSAVLESLAGNLSADNCPVDLHHCAADNWSQFAHQQFDTIILNSVAQYFPSIEYLEHWLAEAVAHVDEGEIFLGDIRNFTLAEAFALSILDHSARPETSAADLRSQLARHLSMEPELLVDPNWFFAIAAQNPRITAVRVLPKKGAAINELTRFRFDVVLSVDKDSPRHPEDWQEFEGLAALQVALSDGPARLALRNIPDSRTRVAQDKARLLRDLPGQASLAQLRKHCETLEAGIDVNVLYELAADGGYRVELCLGAGGLNAVFWRTGDAPNWSSLFASAPRRAARHANVPYQPEQNAALVANLNQALSARLPAYMLPWRIIPLSSLPLTVNGKVDRRALPVPAVSVGGGDGLLGGVGLRVAGIWGEVLGLSAATFGGEENFFALGGHSLLATQVISKIRAGFGVEMPLRALFEQPTIRGLAALIEAEMLSGEAALPAPVAEPRVAGGPQGFPLSFAQARLWFLDQLAPGDLAYSLPVALAIEGPLDVSALAAAFGGLVARHEVLRSRFVLQGGAPVQIIDPVAEGPFELPLTDLGAGLGAGEMLEGLSDADRQEAVAAAIQAEAGTSFQLAQGPLLRARLLALGRDSHVLIVNMHHIVSDGWSMGVLLREIAHLYEAHVAGRTPDLPPLPVQYADYAQWQRDWLQGAALDRQLAYWQGHLKGLPGLLALPTDRPRPPVQSHRGAALALTLDAGLVARLEALGRAQGATLHMVLTGVLSVLLARWSGQDDIAIGTPVAGRRHEALEGLIGFFVNTLVLRTRIDPEEDFAALLDRVRDDALEGLAHQDLPFEHLVEAMAPARDLSHAPLFQVMLALQNAPLGEMGFGGLSLSPIGFDASHAKFDITLSLQDDLTGPASDGGHRALSGTLEYATDLFDAATMARLAGQFVQLARAVADAPRQPCATLPLMSAEDRDRTIAAWAAKPGPETTRARTGQTLAQLFEDAVRRWPERTALRHEGTSIGYDQLNRRANQMAHHLMALGAGPDQVIGICTQRCPEMIVAILAILKAGAAYLPLDPDHPDDRIAYMLADANPGIVLTTPDLTPRLETLTQASILDLTQPLETPDTNTKPKTTPNNLAYVIYTSGSTGKPKGTMVENDAVVRLFSATDDWFGFNETDVWTLFHSYAFDFSVWEMFGALLNGGRMVIVPWLTSRDPEAFHTLLAEEGVTVLNQTPSAFGQLSNHRLALAEPAPLALRLVIFGGEALNRTALQPWFDRHGHDKPQLVNMYGITETTVHVTYQPLVDAPLAIGAIGVPIPDLQTRVLDSALNPLPPGVRGELFVAGPGLARGYLNRPALTAERFVPDPYGPPGARLYRSGDLARILEDGTLEYMGRADAQVKIRGFRIETGEIEAALSAIPGVSGAIVLARDGKLVAWHASSLSASDLRDHLGRDLPDYMVPATFVALDKLPLTANGKIDRSALPDPEPEAAPDFAAPRTAREQALADIWADVLGRDRVGIHDNFFTSGGDSMRAVALAAKARDRGIRVDLGALFRHQTIAALATTLGKDSPRPSLPPLSDADQRLLPPTAETAWPMTRLQLGMVFHAQVDGAAGVYHDIFSFRLRVGWHEESFRKALNLLADRHPILRTSFDLARYSQPLQIVHREVTLPISVIDISGKDGTAQDILIAEAIAAEKANPFLLEEAPLLRIAVHLRGHGQMQITLGIHHAILDGWSVAALQVELLDCWARLRRGEPVELAPLASDYSASIAAEIEAIADPENRTWWADNLDGQGLLTLPTPKTDLGGALPDEPVRCDVEHELQTRLRDLAARLGLPLRSILLAAHLRVLALWGGTLDVTSGVVCHIRTEAPDSDKVLGLFLNTLPLRLRIQPESWRALINRVFEAELGLLAHRFYPLAQIVEDNGHQPLFDVMFNYIDFHVHDLLEDRSAELLEVSSFDVTNFGLGVNAIAQGRQLTINFAHDPRRVETRVVERIAESYLTALRSIAEDCDALADSPVVSRDQALLEQWNTTEVAYDQNGQTLTDLIEARAASQPDEVALHFEGMEISFATLNGRANRLAHHLRSRGVGADSIVGLCAHRSIEMIVAIVAILKAGGAWLPLPPDAPADRLTMMVEDARPVLILAAPGDAADLAASLPAPVLSLAADLPAGPLTNPAPLSGPETLAYVIFTSGSTGRPKGVGVAHRAIVNRLVWMAEEYKIGPADHILQKTPFGFDVSVWELILPLITGARMVIARAEGHLDPTYLSGLMRSQRVTVTHFVPPMLDVFLAVTRPGDGTSLRAVICSGQALTRATQDRFHEAYPDCGLHNLYGPTEAAVDVTAHPCRPEDAGTTVPIGRAIANVRLYVLDETLSPLPPGVVGQLYIGGVALARGYVNRPDLTAASFIPDPFAAPGARMYRTGDLARYLPDGSIDYLGRSDDQVKIRGMRIELGEVEAALLASGPREAVVMARADAMGEAQLIAWLSGWDGNADALRAALAPRLPEQMVPSHFIGLETLPLNANGKVDRRALPDPDRVETAYLPPRTATEEALCRIWSATLGLQQISRDANFFRLGGHSLSVLRMLSTVQRELGAIVSLRTFLSCPDLASLALAIDGIHDALSEPLLDETETETILL